jgi:cyclophilin family peptidyl-prolyl cis-trans isomerase
VISYQPGNSKCVTVAFAAGLFLLSQEGVDWLMELSAQMKGLAAILVLAAGVLTISGCGNSSQQEGAGQNSTTAVSNSNEAKNDSSVANADKQADLITTTTVPPATATTKLAPTTTTTKAKVSKYYATIKTNKGNIVFELRPDKAPETVKSFIKLANSGFYNGIKWHRVEPGFVIQGGDPLSKDGDPSNDGNGGPGFTLKAEFNDLKHLTGTVAMARTANDINSAGSQFYICLAPAQFLDGQYTIFGQVVDGMNVVNSIKVGDVMQKITISSK